MREKCLVCGKEHCICKKQEDKHNHEHHHSCECDNHEENKKLNIIFFIVSVIIFIITVFILPENFKIIGYLITVILAGKDLLIEGLKNIFKLNFEEDTLMTIAVIAAFILGEFPESCMVIILFRIGEYLEDKTLEKSEKNIETISGIKEEYANIIDENGQAKKVDSKSVKVGEKILIKPGEKVPLDCLVLQGKSCLDTSAITGESKYQDVNVNEHILSGSININGVLVCEVEKDYNNSMASQIVDLVYEASNNKGKTENFITKFSKVYTPTVMICALLIAILPPLFGILDFKTWIYRSLIFLVAACPCSIVISVPVAMFAGVGAMAKKGLLVKGTKHIESISNSTIIAFDKTGTLTTGKMTLDKLEIISNYSREDILGYIVNLEMYSNHPISNIFKKLENEVSKKEVKSFEEIPGLGLYGKIDNNEVLFGNKKLLKQYKINMQKELEDATYLVINNIVVAYVTVKEEIIKENYNIVQELRKQGIKKTVMLTGDNQKAAEIIGKALNIDEVYAELLPQEKQKKILQLKENGYNIIFVGDGINDGPVLASANLGMSMGVGTEIANQISDCILMTNKISVIPDAIKIAKKTLKIVKLNVGFSLFVKLIVFILGIMGIAPMWLAVLADTGVTMITVANSMRIFKTK